VPPPVNGNVFVPTVVVEPCDTTVDPGVVVEVEPSSPIDVVVFGTDVLVSFAIEVDV